MSTKTPVTQRAVHRSTVPPGGKQNDVVREQLRLRSLPDCLLAAYDGVSRRAFERFVARGSKTGSEIADWRTAEREMFLPVVVDIQDTAGTLYALATITGAIGSQIAVAIEDRWLLISGHVEAEDESEQQLVAPTSRGRDKPQSATHWIDWDELHSVLTDSEAIEDFTNPQDDEDSTNPVRSRPFCVIELPVEVDVLRSTAVLSGGLLAIRMPKRIEGLPVPA
jgi:HSP20 family molecular chaperone IbpA